MLLLLLLLLMLMLMRVAKGVVILELRGYMMAKGRHVHHSSSMETIC